MFWKRIIVAAGMMLMMAMASPQTEGQAAPEPLTAGQIVARMLSHDRSQADQLKHYQDRRHYRVEYRGFKTSISAQMDVDMSYDAATGKSFRIVDESGSKLLRDKVLKKAMDSEREASQDKDSAALAPANYNFQLVGSEVLDGRPSYILQVDPRTPGKFLYKGKVWVDAKDFALSKIEAEPAKDPSFWILRPQIHFRAAKVGAFWLPERNRSETKARVGGTAVLTIDYGTYLFDKKPNDAAE